MIDAGVGPLRANVLERSPRRIEAAISAFKQQPHVGWNDRVRRACIVVLLANQQRIRRIQIDDPAIGRNCSDALTRLVVQKSDQSHVIIGSSDSAGLPAPACEAPSANRVY